MHTNKAQLRPDASVHKVLISTTSRLVGEYVSEGVLITHATHHYSNSEGAMRCEESPVSRNAFIVAFRINPPKKKDIIIPDYAHVGELICSYMAVLYGKRFDSHGLTEGSGFYSLPNLNIYNSIFDHRFIFNSHKPRNCFSVPLNIEHFSVFEKLLFDESVDSKFKNKFQAASKFYLQALQIAEIEPEIAYLHLITAGEIIAGYYEYNKEDVIDDVMSANLSKIRAGLEDGDKIANQVMGRLLSVKRRFVMSLCSLLDDDFFKNYECNEQFACFKKEDIEKKIGAAYDLRSKYVHTGVPFGMWIQPSRMDGDIQSGKPVVDDKEFGKVLAKAPKFMGLERVIRYCLLKFLCTHEFDFTGINKE